MCTLFISANVDSPESKLVRYLVPIDQYHILLKISDI